MHFTRYGIPALNMESLVKYERIRPRPSLTRGETEVRYVQIFIVALILLSGYPVAKAGGIASPDTTVQSGAKQDPTPEEIIEKFTQKETEFYNAWMQYTYRQTASIRVVSVDGFPPRGKEEMTIVSEVVFKDDGSREVRVTRSTGRLRSVGMTEEDMEVMNNINPFALTKEELPLYEVKYRGKERVDELICYVFSVKPKRKEGHRLYFEGKIWVDDLDLQVVRTIGKPVPQSRDNQFPEFETIRQVIDGKYWFPVWTHADDDLHFPDNRVRIEETIVYEDYRKFGSDATIQYETTPEQQKQ